MVKEDTTMKNGLLGWVKVTTTATTTNSSKLTSTTSLPLSTSTNQEKSKRTKQTSTSSDKPARKTKSKNSQVEQHSSNSIADPCDNYVTRLHKMLQQAHKARNQSAHEAQLTSKFMADVSAFIVKHTTINGYLTTTNTNSRDVFRSIKSNRNVGESSNAPIELIALDDDDNDSQDEAVVIIESETNKLNEQSKSLAIDDTLVSTMTILLRNENLNKKHEKIIELLQSLNTQIIEQFCHRLIASGLNENDIYILITCLIDEAKKSSTSSSSSSSSFLTYKAFTVFLELILTEYVLASLRSSITQSDTVLTRKFLSLSLILFKSFTSQFVEACFLKWLFSINKSKLEANSDKQLGEFLLKLVSDTCDNKIANQIIQLACKTCYLSVDWHEFVYHLIGRVLDKSTSLHSECVSLLVNKMKEDRVRLNKNIVFSKVLVAVLKKAKHCYSHADTAAVSYQANDSTIELTQSVSSQQIHFEPISLLRQRDIMTTVSEKESLWDASLKEAVLVLVDSNETIVKKTLLSLTAHLR